MSRILLSLSICLAILSSSLIPLRAQDDVTVVLEPDRMATQTTRKTNVDVDAGTDTYTANNARLNTVFRVLAAKAGLQYFSNPDLEELTISGNINGDQPRETILDLAATYNLVAYDNGKTLFVRPAKTMDAMPTRAISYEIRYLRQANIEKLIEPMLTPGKGRVRLEPKTNVLLIEDNDFVLNNIMNWLAKVDMPKRQINIQVQILKLAQTNELDTGVDWKNVLGGGINDGGAAYPIDFGIENSLNMLFNLSGGHYTPSGGTGVGGIGATGGTGAIAPASKLFTAPTAAILSPGQVSLAVHALRTLIKGETGDNANIVLEDNEAGLISNVDRYPIVEFQPASAQASGANFISLSSTVRYQIDKSDPIPSETNPGRELGVSMSITPTCLPDGTIRLQLSPRVATVTQFITVPTGVTGANNQVPRVSETRSVSTVRVPDGKSLLLGGFYDVSKNITDNKLPILGDIPGVNFLFKNKDTSTVKTRIVFVITPTSFDPGGTESVVKISEKFGHDLNERAPYSPKESAMFNQSDADEKSQEKIESSKPSKD